MTSNLGARHLDKRGQLGFSAPNKDGVPSKVEDMVMAEVKRAFNPEFLNRLDEVILFNSLTRRRSAARSSTCWWSRST